MGFFKNLFSKISKKDKKIVESIAQKNIENRVITSNNSQKSKFEKSLKKSSSLLNTAIKSLIKPSIKIDDDWYDELEEILISYDIGYNASTKLIQMIRNEIELTSDLDDKKIKEIIIEQLFNYYIQDGMVDTQINLFNNKTNVVLIVGANGVGKTTSIAKIAKMFKDQNKKVLLVAGDTFRAGAIEQLSIWSEKLNVDIIKPNTYNEDPASVIYKGLDYGYKNNYDLIICDTSGRLQNKVNLMAELKKIYNVIAKFDKSAPHESLLVLDATTGQSGLSQAKNFNECANLTGIVLAKVDSTSKGGLILAIKENFDLPVKLIGTGEGIDDLSVFDLESFIEGLIQDLDLNYE